jgi:hypothetical protein
MLIEREDIKMANTQNTGFDTIQAIVIQHYANGDHLVALPSDVPHCGDGLLKYLLVELSQSEDCGDIQTAVQRLDKSIEQLAALKIEFEKAELAQIAGQ